MIQNSNPNRRYNGRGRGNYNNRHNNMNNHNNGNTFMNGGGIPNQNQNGYNRQSMNHNYHQGPKQTLLDDNPSLDHSGQKMSNNLLPSPINSTNQVAAAAAAAAQANYHVAYGRYDSNVMPNGTGGSMPLSIPNGMSAAGGAGPIDQSQLQNGYQYYGGSVPYAAPISPYAQMPLASQSAFYYTYSNPAFPYYGQVPANYGYGMAAPTGAESAPMQTMISPVGATNASLANSYPSYTCSQCRQVSVKQAEACTMTD